MYYSILFGSFMLISPYLSTTSDFVYILLLDCLLWKLLKLSDLFTLHPASYLLLQFCLYFFPNFILFLTEFTS